MPDIYAPDLTLSFVESQASNRWAFEREKLRKFPSFQFVGSGAQIVAAQGTLDTQFGNTYAVRIGLANFPYRKPTIRLTNYTVHPLAPHQFNDGTICIMREEQWRSCFTVALVVAKTAIWLGKYELWKRERVWPGLGQSH